MAYKLQLCSNIYTTELLLVSYISNPNTTAQSYVRCLHRGFDLHCCLLVPAPPFPLKCVAML